MGAAYGSNVQRCDPVVKTKAWIGICLCPLIYAGFLTTWDLGAFGWDQSVNGLFPIREAMLWALGGAALWTLVFLVFDRPVWLYVIGHELTHALFAILQGIPVLSMTLNREGGQVELRRINWLVSLSPYFFPIYTMVVLLAYAVLWRFIPVPGLVNFWMGLIGLTWGFHVTFTITTLGIRQTDILHEGRIFSAAVIVLFNILVVLIWLIALMNPGWSELTDTFVGHLEGVWQKLVALFERLAEASRG